MKPLPRLAWLALPVLASFCPGCGCGNNRQVVYPARKGAPLEVDSSAAPAARPGTIDLQAPTPDPAQAGDIDVPMFDLDTPSPR